MFIRLTIHKGNGKYSVKPLSELSRSGQNVTEKNKEELPCIGRHLAAKWVWHQYRLPWFRCSLSTLDKTLPKGSGNFFLILTVAGISISHAVRCWWDFVLAASRLLPAPAVAFTWQLMAVMWWLNYQAKMTNSLHLIRTVTMYVFNQKTEENQPDNRWYSTPSVSWNAV